MVQRFLRGAIVMLPLVLALSSPVLGAPEASVVEDEIDRVVKRLPEVVVEGTAWSGLPVVPLEEPRSHDVLSPRRVRDVTVTTYEEVVKRLPGVTSRLYSGDEYVRPSISTRGMPDNGFTEYAAVLVDGINMSTLFYGWTAISIFPFTPERIYAAEVIRGGHAVRYGPNTIGGIVNVTTRPVPEDALFTQKTTFGSYNYHSTMTEFGGRIPGSDFALLGTFVEKGGDTFRDNNRFDINEFAIKGLWDIDEATQLTFSAFHWRAIHGLPSRLTREQIRDDPEQNSTPDWVDWHGWSYGANFTLKHRMEGEDWIQAYGYYRLARRALDSGRPTSGPPFDSERSADSDMINEGFGVEGEYGLEFGTAHIFHFGARIHRETIHRKTFQIPVAAGGSYSFTQNADSENVAISLNLDDTVRFGDFLITAGARYEWLPTSEARDRITDVERDFNLSTLLPGASVSYATSEHVAIFANAHKSFRPPQTWSYDFSEKKQDLDFEEGATYELGVRVDELSGISGSVVFWLVDFSEFIDYDDVTDTYTNLGAYQSRGIDLTVEVDTAAAFGGPEGLALFGTVTRQNSEFDKGEFDGNDTPFVPQWSGNGGVRYDHSSGVYGVFETHYWGRSPTDGANTLDTPGYGTSDLRLGWRSMIELGEAVLDLDVSLAAKNVFDREYYLKRNSNSYIPGAPRELFGSVSVSIDF